MCVCLMGVLLWAGEVVCFGQAVFDGHEAKLVVRDCLPEDAGAYTCLAENPAGKTSSSAAVCVKGELTLTCNLGSQVAERLGNRASNLKVAGSILGCAK